ncbi:MAG: hypothetical protein EOO53_13720 [Gammaproteobacteria bacterium]|nr:MAG: hypothetical protein EOO53_13720 [Gammaproteobacteria bacterium]
MFSAIVISAQNSGYLRQQLAFHSFREFFTAQNDSAVHIFSPAPQQHNDSCSFVALSITKNLKENDSYDNSAFYNKKNDSAVSLITH